MNLAMYRSAWKRNSPKFAKDHSYFDWREKRERRREEAARVV